MSLSRRIFLSLTLVLFVFGAVSFSFTGCGQKGEQKIRIGFLVKNPEERWFQDEWKFARKCAEEYGFEVITIGATDGEKVLSNIDNLAAQGAQGFVICIPDVRLGPAVMARAESHKMKVFAVDDQFVGADGNFMDVPYMGIAARTIGETVGKALYEEFVKRGWRIEETGAAGITFEELNTVKERTDGTIDALTKAGFPADKIFKSPEKTTDVPSAFDAANTLLTQHPEVKRWLVFSVNDEGVLGAVRAMENHGFHADTVIGVGIGGPSAISEFEKSGPTGFYSTCLISPYRHGFETTEHLYKWIKEGIEPPKDTRTVGIMVDRTNYLQVMREQGILDDSPTVAVQDTTSAQ
ncbi:MAG: arabinose ABC transporter substrate-binding protein [Candidatus Latescibacterota bacterium]